MVVLIVLFGSLALFRIAGVLGVSMFDSWIAASRWALAAMLVFTAVAHFNRMKEDMIGMLPAWVPWPRQTVFLTGVLEVLGALGILVESTRRLTGVLLVLYFIAVFPANVHAARTGASIGGRPATPLWLRIPMQLLFIGLAWWIARSA